MLWYLMNASNSIDFPPCEHSDRLELHNNAVKQPFQLQRPTLFSGDQVLISLVRTTPFGTLNESGNPYSVSIPSSAEWRFLGLETSTNQISPRPYKLTLPPLLVRKDKPTTYPNIYLGDLLKMYGLRPYEKCGRDSCVFDR